MLIKKITEIYIGSNNKGKLREIRDLLPKNIKILSPLSTKTKSPNETSNSFKGNSLLKARYYSKISGKICLADDSGLEIDILNNSPGIYSSRWAGKNNNFNIAIKRIYKELNLKNKNIINSNYKIKARFICALTLYGPNFKTVTVEGKIKGIISKKKKGSNGFGYDPIFIPYGKKLTFGQMKPSVKLKIDHRFRAFKKIRKFF